MKTEAGSFDRSAYRGFILKAIDVRDGLIRMSDLAPDDLLQHTALSEPRNSEPSRGMWGSIRDVLGHPITQCGLFQRQPVLTLEKEAAVLSLLFRAEVPPQG